MLYASIIYQKNQTAHKEEQEQKNSVMSNE